MAALAKIASLVGRRRSSARSCSPSSSASPRGMLVVAALGLTMLVRRDWVPVVYNVRSLGVRRWTTAVTGARPGAGRVRVHDGADAGDAACSETLKATGSADNAKIIRKGSQNEVQSGVLARAPAPVVGGAGGGDGQGRQAAGVAGADGAHLRAARRRQDDEEGTNVNVRGVGPTAIELHPPRQLEGRMFTPGTSEIVIGKGLAGRFKGMTLGGRCTSRGATGPSSA